LGIGGNEMIKLSVDLELDEERLREIFEGQDIKFSKKKATELKRDLANNEYVQEILEEKFEEFVEELIWELFEQ
jgi:transposase